MKIERTVTVGLEITTQEFADIFWEMNSVEQAEFFTHLGEIAELSALRVQMHAVGKELAEMSTARDVLRVIGEGAWC